MFDRDWYAPLLDAESSRFPDPWREQLPERLAAAFDRGRHGKWPEWRDLLDQFPRLTASRPSFDRDAVTVGLAGDLSADDRERTERLLQRLHPWRKGPFRVCGIDIDAEWRSNLKWNRLRNAIAPLRDRMVLDIGCGNGYYAWRMVGQGARSVIGIDPTLSHVVQFFAIKHFAGAWPAYVLPLGIEDVPPNLRAFDTVFSMGVLYHRRSPIDHLQELRGCLRPGGQLVLETLVVEGGLGHTLLPEDRYAQMRNVWFIPSVATLASWLVRCGFQQTRVIDVSPTTVAEQRSTHWMRFQSLADFLDPENPALTTEGYPAPRRAILLAEAP